MPNPADIPKTANVTPFALFEYMIMQFGFKKTAQTFQRLVDRLFAGLPYVFIYLDDMLISTTVTADHVQALHQVCSILEASGLVLTS